MANEIKTLYKNKNKTDAIFPRTKTEAITDNSGKTLSSELDGLKNSIENIKSIGRFLAIWDASTGKPTSEPTNSPYKYKVGDYYRIGVAGTKVPKSSINYIIGGINYEEGSKVELGDVLYCSNITETTSTWVLQASGGGGKVQDVQVNGTSVLSGGVANVTVPTKTSELTNDKGYQTASEVSTAISGKLDKTGGTIYDSGNFRPLAIKGDSNGGILDYYKGDNTRMASSGYYSGADMCYVGPEKTYTAGGYPKLGICYSTGLPVFSPNNGSTKYTLVHAGNVSDYVPTKTSQLTNDGDGTNAFLTQHQDLSGKQDTITSSNKLSASLVDGLSTVATSGDYDNLSNKPTIPTKTSQLTNDGDGTNAFLTQHQNISGKANISGTLMYDSRLNGSVDLNSYGANYKIYASTSTNQHKPADIFTGDGTYGKLITLPWENSGDKSYCSQLYISQPDLVNPDRLYLRGLDTASSTWNAWKKVAFTSDIPTVGNGTITIKQGSATKGTFSTNQSENTTIELDAGTGSETQYINVSGLTITTTEQTTSDSALLAALRNIDIKKPVVLYNIYRKDTYDESNIDYTTTSYKSTIYKNGSNYYQEVKIYNYRNFPVTLGTFHNFIGSFSYSTPIPGNSEYTLIANIGSTLRTPSYVYPWDGEEGEHATDGCYIEYTYTDSSSIVNNDTMAAGYYVGYDYTAVATAEYLQGGQDGRNILEFIAPVNTEETIHIKAYFRTSGSEVKYWIENTSDSNFVRINMGRFTFKHNARSSTSQLGNKIATKLAAASINKGKQILIYNFRLLTTANDYTNTCILNTVREALNDNEQVETREFEGVTVLKNAVYALNISIGKVNGALNITSYNIREVSTSQVYFRGLNISSTEVNSSTNENVINDLIAARTNNITVSGEEISLAPIGLYGFKVNNGTRSNYANLLQANNAVLPNTYSFYNTIANYSGGTSDNKYTLGITVEKMPNREGTWEYVGIDPNYSSRKYKWRQARGTGLNLATLDLDEGSATYGFSYSTSYQSYFVSGLIPQNRNYSSSYAYAKIPFTTTEANTNLVISYYQGSEVNYDYGLISQLDKYLTYSTNADSDSTILAHSCQGESGTHAFTISVPTAGEHFITIKYIKDGSVNRSPDLFAITGLTLSISGQYSYIYTGYSNEYSSLVGKIVCSRELINDNAGSDTIGSVATHNGNYITISWNNNIPATRARYKLTECVTQKYMHHLQLTFTQTLTSAGYSLVMNCFMIDNDSSAWTSARKEDLISYITNNMTKLNTTISKSATYIKGSSSGAVTYNVINVTFGGSSSTPVVKFTVFNSAATSVQNSLEEYSYPTSYLTGITDIVQTL